MCTDSVRIERRASGELAHGHLLVARLIRAAANRRGNRVIPASVVSKSTPRSATSCSVTVIATGRTEVRRSEAYIRDCSNRLKRNVMSPTRFGYVHQLLDERRQHWGAIDARPSEV